MRQLTITFSEYPSVEGEIAEIVERVAEEIRSGIDHGTIYDKDGWDLQLAVWSYGGRR